MCTGEHRRVRGERGASVLTPGASVAWRTAWCLGACILFYLLAGGLGLLLGDLQVFFELL